MDNKMTTSLLALAMTGLLLSSAAMADPVNITVTGRVIAAACTVDTTLVNGLQVDLGSSGRTNFQNAGQAGAWKSFALKLTNCPAGTAKSTATFSGTESSSDSKLFANTEPTATAAKNVAVQMVDDTNHSTTIGDKGTMTVNVDTTTKTATFPLAARLYTPTGGVTAGKVSATVLVSFTYQ